MRPACRVVIASAIVVWLAATAWVSGQTTGAATPPLTIPSMSGRDLFEFYCASCHGRDGRGGGPIASSLKTRPSDLTIMARRHGGTFPTDLVETRVRDGGTLSGGAHGSSDMPVWGPIFKALDPRDSPTRVRISNIVSYIESMQVR